jgi:hypothetical protein
LFGVFAPGTKISAIEVRSHARNDGGEVHVAAIVEHCAATVTELKGSLPARLLCRTDRLGHQPSTLARCARLEVLTKASRYVPAVWLVLSHLHTLHDVDLSTVSTAAIAAALPRLHTLTASGYLATNPVPVAGFFTDLLPRLRVFHFTGKWPVLAAAEEESVTGEGIERRPLPFLEDLVWEELGSPQPTVLREFLGARPVVLRAPYELVAECLLGRGDGEPAGGMLARVCELRIRDGVHPPVDLSDLAQLFLAVPQLRAFSTNQRFRGGTSWLITSTAPLHPAFVGLVHRRLRYVGLPTDPLVRPSSDCASRLQRACFPRLREMEVGRETFLAIPLDPNCGSHTNRFL